MRVLILRPEPGNGATARAVEAMGLEPVCVPLFEVVPRPWSPPDPVDFGLVVLTSAAAPRHGGTALKRYTHLPLVAVGEATALAARAAGFDDIRVGTGGAEELRDLCGDAAVLHLVGADHLPLNVAGTVTTRLVYEARQRALSPWETTRLASPLALLHSSRAAAVFASLATSRAATTIVAISLTAADACGSGWASVHVAGAPREHAMLETLGRLCKTHAA